MSKFDFIETDRRIVEQKIRKHLLSQQEYVKLMKTLPDERDYVAELAIGDKHAELEKHSEGPHSG